MIFISWQQPIGVLPDTIADMAQPATGQANTAMESAEAGGGDADSYEYPYGVIHTDLPTEIQCRLLPGKCSVLMAWGL